MAEAVIRVTRQAAESAAALHKLSREAAEARQNVAGLDTDLAAFKQRQDELARQKKAGRPLTDEERQRVADRYTPAQVESARMVGNTMFIPKAPGNEQAAPAPGRRPLTDAERERLAEKYTSAELQRAVWLRPPTDHHAGTLLMQPTQSEGVTGVADDGGRLLPGPMYSQGGLSTGQARRKPTTPPQNDTAEVDDETRATLTQEQAVARLTKAKQRDGLTDRELRRDHRENLRDLREQDRDIDRLTNRIDRLRTMKASVQRDEEMQQSRARLEDLRTGRQAMIEERDDIAAEARRRGMRDDAGILTGGGRGRGDTGDGRGGGRSYLSAFLGAAGFGGGGGVGGLIAGGITGAMSLPMMGVSAAGLLVGAGLSRATRGYQRYVEQTGAVLPTAVAGHKTADGLLNSTRTLSDRYGIFDAPSIRAALLSLSRSTGHAYVEDAADVAALTGQSPLEEASRVGGMARFSPRVRDYTASRLFQAFQRSAAGSNRLLYPQFGGYVQNLQRSGVTPSTRVDPEGMASELAAATNELRFPGIDMGGPGGMDVAANAVGTTNNLVGKEQGGLLGELQLMAIARLRQNPQLVERLKSFHDIDINTVPGMLRAIEAAPRLAALPKGEGGTPEVAEVLFKAPIEALPPWIAEMELGDRYRDRNLAHAMVKDPDSFLSIIRAGGRREGDVSSVHDEAMSQADRPDVSRFKSMYVTPQNELEALGQSMAPEGDVVQRGMNEMKGVLDEGMKSLVGAVRDTLREVLSSDSGLSSPVPNDPSAGAGPSGGLQR